MPRLKIKYIKIQRATGVSQWVSTSLTIIYLSLKVSNEIIAGILYKNDKKMIKRAYGIWLMYATRYCGKVG